MAKSKSGMKSGKPFALGSKPAGMDHPPHGTHPMVKGDPSKGNMGKGKKCNCGMCSDCKMKGC